MTISSLYGVTVPAVSAAGSSDPPVSLGFKFRTSVDGWITHVRFYRDPANVGIHVVNLWRVDSEWAGVTLLATKSTDGSEASGWVNVQLDTPIAVTAAQDYLAGYHVAAGNYSLDSHFYDSPVVSGALIGLSNSAAGGNGVYDYGDATTVPSSSFGASSYGVDVYFTDVNPGGSADITATLTTTEAAETLIGVAGVGITGQLVVTEISESLTAFSVIGVTAVLTVTEAAETLSGAAVIGVTAVLTVTEATETLTGTATVQTVSERTASLVVTEGDERLIASARVTVFGQRLTLSEIIPSILNDLVGKRVWQMATPDNLPRGVDGQFLPFILWHRVGGQDQEFVEGTMSTHRHARIQVQSCSPSAIAADTLHEAVCQALLASAYTVGVLGSPVGTYDATRKLHAPWQQFSIWFQP